MVIRSIDVGYGQTKFTIRVEKGREPECAHFPSITSVGASRDLSAGILERRNTRRIEVGGAVYEVGPDAAMTQRVKNARILHEAYTETDAYLALVRGALSYMEVPYIHLLVTGLPVSLLQARGSGLIRRLQGDHAIPGGQVTVGKVWVVPQPLGALVHHGTTANIYDAIRDQVNLVVDPGYYTVDWLLSYGIKPDERRSGSHPGGVSAILNEVADAISNGLGTLYTNLAAIDDALRGDGGVRIAGQRYNLNRHHSASMPVVDEAVNAIASRLGEVNDIDNIILVGGGADYFAAALKRQFPHHRIATCQEPLYANVRGFQMAGEARASTPRTQKKREAV